MVKNPFITKEFSNPEITEAVTAAYNQNVADGTATNKTPTTPNIAEVATEDTIAAGEVAPEVNRELMYQLAKDILEKKIKEYAEGEEMALFSEETMILEQLEKQDNDDLASKIVVEAIISGEISDNNNIQTAWVTIDEIGGVETAKYLADHLFNNEKPVPGEYLKDALQVIKNHGDDLAASYLIPSLRNNLFEEEDDQSEIWQFIERVGDQNTLINIELYYSMVFGDNKNLDEHIKKVYDIIYKRLYGTTRFGSSV